MKFITSASNELIKHVVRLHSTKGRTQHKQFIAQGARVCTTLINAGHNPLHLFVTEQQTEFITQFPSFTYFTVSDALMKKISTSSTPAGIVGVFSIPPVTLPDSFTGPGLILAHLADPGNVGTLIRTAAALNIKTIIVVDGVDPWSPKVIQASAGTIGMIMLHRISWPNFMSKKGATHLAALVVSGGENIQTIDSAHTFLVVGNEAHGIAPEILANCDTQITLAMPGNTESLNAAIAGSIALYLFLHCFKKDSTKY